MRQSLSLNIPYGCWGRRLLSFPFTFYSANLIYHLITNIGGSPRKALAG
jgi:hypothetical protein